MTTTPTGYDPAFTWRWPENLTAAAEAEAAVTVSQDGAWSGPIGMTGQWSADDRMLMPPADKQVRTRPRPLPLLVQWRLAAGHDAAEMGYARVDEVWLDGPYVMGRGQIDTTDPAGARLAAKVRGGFVRFVSLDVDDATERQVTIGESGEVLENADAGPGGRMGLVYDTWRAMGATLVPHPAFPDAAISMADPATGGGEERAVQQPVEMHTTKEDVMSEAALAAGEMRPEPEGDVSSAGGCVVPLPDGGWRAAPCDAEGAVPANAAGDGPAREVEEAVAEATEEEAAAQGEPAGAEQVPAEGEHDDPADPDGPADEPAEAEPGEADPAAEEPPRVPVGEEQVRAEPRAEGEPARDIGNGCVKPVGEAGGFEPCDCADPAAVTADATGGPLRYATETALAVEAFSPSAYQREAEELQTRRENEPPLPRVPYAQRGEEAKGREQRRQREAAFMSLAASAFAHPRFRPETAWFRDPQLDGPTLITIDAEGRIAGHLALWGVPHVAYQGSRVFAPHSPTRYDRFHARPIHTSEGLVEVGVLAMGTDHARPYASAGAAVAHYDSTGSIVGAVRCGEDAHGIWMAGALLPDVPDDERLRLSLATFSGDWRDEGRGLDLKAALAVPAGHEGFHVPKAPAGARAGDYALVASGALTAEHVGMVRLLEERITAASRRAVEGVLAEQREKEERAARAAAAAGKITAFRARQAARRIRVQEKGLTSPTALQSVLAKEFPGVKPGTKTDTELARNWVDAEGGLPPLVKRIANRLKDKGFEESHAIATAVNVVKKMCTSGDTNFPGAQRVGAQSRAQACAAVEKWEAMKAERS